MLGFGRTDDSAWAHRVMLENGQYLDFSPSRLAKEKHRNIYIGDWK